MRIYACYYAIDEQQFQHLKSLADDDEYLLDDIEEMSDHEQCPMVDIVKMWHITHFILTGSSDQYIKHPLTAVIFGEKVLSQDSYVAYNSPQTVQHLALLLEQFDIDTALNHFDIKAGKEAGLYPNIWETETKDAIIYDIQESFDELKQLYQLAAQRNLAILATIY